MSRDAGEALWSWAVGAYARPAVAAACLELQDAHAQNTCLLLWAAWARPEDPAVIGRAADLARAWDEAAVQPLRQARRATKVGVVGVSDGAREALRETVKTAELAAERLLLESLATLTNSSGQQPILASLTAVSQAWGRPAAQKALAVLAAALD